jgi:hypothetical protein
VTIILLLTGRVAERAGHAFSIIKLPYFSWRKPHNATGPREE